MTQSVIKVVKVGAALLRRSLRVVTLLRGQVRCYWCDNEWTYLPTTSRNSMMGSGKVLLVRQRVDLPTYEDLRLEIATRQG